MRTILVAGGAGYIGSHMTALLVERGYRAVVADNLSTGHAQAVPGALLRVGDLRDGVFLDRLFREETIDSVIDFAAYSLVGESMRNPLKYYENNLPCAISLLRAKQEHGVRPFCVFLFRSGLRSAGCTACGGIRSPRRPSIPMGRESWRWRSCCAGAKGRTVCAMPRCAISTQAEPTPARALTGLTTRRPISSRWF